MRNLIAIIFIVLCAAIILPGLVISNTNLKEASFYQKLDDNNVQCLLCPRKCLIKPDKRGFCGVRENRYGKLYTLVYGEAAAAHVDPIEKKPLFHFLPGETAFSIATAGCNLRCKFCQNWEISQCKPEDASPILMSPQQVVDSAKKSNSKTIAYTYTEPTIFYEYMFETAKLAREAGIKNVIHSAGFINEEPLRQLCKYLDAANIDLKGFTQKYYDQMCMGNLDDVLRTLKILKEEKVHLEITNLIVPDQNDSDQDIRNMCVWIKENLGVDTPVHFSRFWPMYKLLNLPPTPLSTLENARSIAESAGLKYVYIGNVPGHQGETTFCPKCKKALIVRLGYNITENNIIYGKCKFCGEKIEGVWEDEIKEPNVAGRFYPENKDALEKQVDSMLDKANSEQANGEIFAIISPHAGFDFSGQTAAFGYKLVKDKPYKTVVVIAPSHHYAFSGISVYPAGRFKTPLGEIVIDSDFCKSIMDEKANISFIKEAFAKEHSLEVQLPFLQRALKNFKIAPVIIGDVDFTALKNFSDKLSAAIRGRSGVLLVASTDMCHSYDYSQTEAIDDITVRYLGEMSAEDLYKKLKDNTAQMCGGMPVVAVMLTAKNLGCDKIKVLKRTNSAQVTGQKVKGAWTVGYVSAVIYKDSTGKINSEVNMLDAKQKKRLLEIARKTIEEYVATGKRLEFNEGDPKLKEACGAFVTLHKKGELRGCIGNIVGGKPLYVTVRDMAIESATADPRFRPVEKNELKDIEIEISALSPLKKITDISEFQLGEHGVIIKKGWNSGVFLPQVALETGWSKEEFLSNLCAHKAGLPAGAWKDSSCEMYIFSATVFSEKRAK